MVPDVTDLSARMLGLDGFRVLAVTVTGSGERWVKIETTATIVGCPDCGVVARSKGRRCTLVRDVASGGLPTVLVWRKRIWRCPEAACERRCWTERHAAIRPKAVLTERARWDICLRVGRDATSVAEMARVYGVSWDTAWDAVVVYGTPLVEVLVDMAADPPRVWAIGIDETSFQRARRGRRTRWASGICDLERGRLLDLVPGREGTSVTRWLEARSIDWRRAVGVVAIDPHAGYRCAVTTMLEEATVVLDRFHLVGLANRRIDECRRRIQHETLGHRGRAGDPLYGIRKLLLCAHERLDARGADRLGVGLATGDPYSELACVHVAKELLRDVLGAESRYDAQRRLFGFYDWCADHADIAELDSLARSVETWHEPILAWWDQPYSNGPTEALNLLVKRIKRVGCGYRRFDNYRLRVLLHCGIEWQTQPRTARLRPHRPTLIA